MLILLNPPYISKTLIAAINNSNVKVLRNNFVKENHSNTFHSDKYISEENKELIEDSNFYTNSENALNWINENFPYSLVNKSIQKLKNKNKFREIVHPLHSGFFFKEISLENLMQLKQLPTNKKVIIKPTIGFLSLGVIKVDDPSQWKRKKKKLLAMLSTVAKYYPEAVVNTSTFIIEEYLDGREFAIDAYYDKNGEPVILNISEHLFASENDVNDRIYFTQKSLIETYHNFFLDYLKRSGELLELKNFPVHAEIRITSSHGIVPIEFNAMRFGGWCTSADVGTHAYGFNVYQYFFEKKKPNWDEILKDRGDELYSFIMLDNSSKVKMKNIKKFRIDKLKATLEDVLETRVFNHLEHPIFGIFITKTKPSSLDELKNILVSDFVDYMEI